MKIIDIADLITEDVHTNNGLVLEASWPEGITTQIFQDKEFQSWLNRLGATGAPSLLGEGGYGRTYQVGDKAVKITPDVSEVGVSERSRLECRDHPNLVKIFGIRTLGRFRDNLNKLRDFYAIVLEVVDDVGKPPELCAAADLVGGYLDVNKAPPIKDVDEAFKICLNYNKEENDPDPNTKINQYVLQLLRIVQSIDKACGLKFKDVGCTNVGWSKGVIKLFDLGLSKF